MQHKSLDARYFKINLTFPTGNLPPAKTGPGFTKSLGFRPANRGRLRYYEPWLSWTSQRHPSGGRCGGTAGPQPWDDPPAYYEVDGRYGRFS